MPQILHISVYGAKTEAATSGRIASLERVRFALSFDANNSMFSFARKCTFPRAGNIIMQIDIEGWFTIIYVADQCDMMWCGAIHCHVSIVCLCCHIKFAPTHLTCFGS